MNTPATRFDRRTRIEWLAFAGMAVLCVLVLAVLAYQAHRGTEGAEAARLALQGQVVAANLERELEAIGHGLAVVRDEVAGRELVLDGEVGVRRLKTLADVMAGVRVLVVADARGMARASNLATLVGRDYSQREEFVAARAGADPQRLYVSQPFTATSGLRTLTLSRAIHDETGTLIGVVAAVLEPAYFEGMMRAVLYAGDMRITLIHDRGQFILQVPPIDTLPVQGVDRPGSFFSQLRDSGREAMVLKGRTAGGRDRLSAGRRLSQVGDEARLDPPLSLFVGRDVDAVFAAWLTRTQLQASVLASALLLAGLMLQVMQGRRRASQVEAERREAQARDTAERVALALQGADLGLWDWRIDTGTTVYNERWAAMLGMALEAVPPHVDSWIGRVHPEDLPAVRAQLDRHLTGETSHFEAEFRMRHNSGDWVWILDRGKVVERDAQGRPLRMVGTHLDITARKQVEAERALLEAQLRESQKMESVGTLAGGIAHDFNNILAAILGNVAMARQDLPAGHPLLPTLEQVSRSAARARDLVQQILAFSRRHAHAPVTQALQPLVGETLAMLRATLPATVQLDGRLDGTGLPVCVDATQMQQVLINLCTNAWHALPEGRGHIEVGVADLPASATLARELGLREGERCVHLWVRDDGCGMDADTRARIFEPFFTTKPVGRGTGLGLAVVHGIVKSHGGSIHVDSTPGQGSTFHLYLPPASDAAIAASPRTLAGPAVPPIGRGQRVLYVDDDEVIGVMVEALLRRAGYVVAVCRTGREALEWLAEHGDAAADLVVTDFAMPEMSGLDLARALAASHPHLPLVISSGYLADDIQQAAREAGVRYFVNKQDTFEELPGLVERVLADAA